MAQELRCVPPETIVTGADFSTSGVKFLAFDLAGHVLAEVRLPTDLWTATHEDVCELNLMQLEGQVRAAARTMAAELRRIGRLDCWAAGGISATHHTASRLDANHVQVRRAICWNDHSLARYHAVGEARLGGDARVRELIGGPWAIRYSLSHLVKDEDPAYFPPDGWQRTYRILPHGPLVAGYLTGNFDVISVSSAASTGIMDLRTNRWRWEMLDTLEKPEHRELVKRQLPYIVDQYRPVGRLAKHLALEAGIDVDNRPFFFPTSDDQQAGLVGGGAVEDGQLAVILGKSAVVNSSSALPPSSGTLDVMRLNWGPYLWMRCYNNGAQFLDEVFVDGVAGRQPDWDQLEQQGRAQPPGAGGAWVLPFVHPEPSLGVKGREFRWQPANVSDPGQKFRACLEALAWLIARGVREHEKGGQTIRRITVSGGIAKSDLMCKILATLLNRPLARLVSSEGPALGAAVTALAALETHLRRQQGIAEPFTVADAVGHMVQFRDEVRPDEGWAAGYRAGPKDPRLSPESVR